MERVLIIDDNPADRALLCMAMEFIAWPAHTIEFGNAVSAINQMHEWTTPPPTVIFLDYMLGSTVSTPWIARLREVCPSSATMIVLHSTVLPSEPLQKQCITLGACVFLEKTGTFPELVNLVEHVRKTAGTRNGKP